MLYSFTGGPDGEYPAGNLLLDSKGDLYGTTEYGGTANAGVVYKVNTSGQETVLHSFTGAAEGSTPGCVIRGASGDLFGIASGGRSNTGIIFERQRR